MQVLFEPLFVRDFRALERGVQQDVRKFCVDVMPSAETLQQLLAYNIRPMRKFKGYYRTRLGDYRIGFKYKDNTVIFMRVLHRRDIYRHFP